MLYSVNKVLVSSSLLKTSVINFKNEKTSNLYTVSNPFGILNYHTEQQGIPFRRLPLSIGSIQQ